MVMQVNSNVGYSMRTDRFAKWVLLGCLFFLLVGYSQTRPVADFGEYWSSAHLLANHKNPYSILEMSKLERSLGWENVIPLMNLNPPWSLAFILPLGIARSYTLACTIWTALLAFAAWWSTRILFSIYSPFTRIFSSEQGLLVFTFLPAVMCMKFSQTTSLVLLGITGYLWFQSRERYGLAGTCLALAAIKPQLLYLVWLALALNCCGNDDGRQLRPWR